eukprot:GHVS01040897.1.p1 GENE.GHVS01040897.1~~GHVS01040897.1.p1  ORF type:complete len:287 (-),score=67.88 GHVS01040897.1:161-1021(-)
MYRCFAVNSFLATTTYLLFFVIVVVLCPVTCLLSNHTQQQTTTIKQQQQQPTTSRYSGVGGCCSTAARPWLFKQLLSTSNQCCKAQQLYDKHNNTTTSPPANDIKLSIVVCSDVVVPCLVWLETPTGYKAIAPRGTNLYVSVQALNHVRRNHPQKVKALWFGEYDFIFDQLNKMLSTKTLLLSAFLDKPQSLRISLLLLLSYLISCTSPIRSLQSLSTSSAVWQSYHHWAKLLYAPLPLKVLIARLVGVAVCGSWRAVETKVRNVLVDLESKAIDRDLPVNDIYEQ